ncbi:hypothetical protein CJF43_08660 [Pseudomonas fragi]|uniref:Lipoprotein n=1 Tax=Pseudomonas fragi TaxID=296 RepID=A0A266LYH8_PSEFR|nr:hypothetical protein [Pseudomonas fragi]OZY42462.1 hypothetical protein CJF43_08660 [Pseudomonas fragi]
MKRTILTAIVGSALLISAAQATELTPVPSTPVTAAPGSPGTATPTPYPQITPRVAPKPVAGSTSLIPLPPIDLPQPPKDQPLPGLEPKDPKGKSPQD